MFLRFAMLLKWFYTLKLLGIQRVKALNIEHGWLYHWRRAFLFSFSFLSHWLDSCSLWLSPTGFYNMPNINGF